MSWNLGSSSSWNPQGLSRPVMGLLYLNFNRHPNCLFFLFDLYSVVICRMLSVLDVITRKPANKLIYVCYLYSHQALGQTESAVFLGRGYTYWNWWISSSLIYPCPFLCIDALRCTPPCVLSCRNVWPAFTECWSKPLSTNMSYKWCRKTLNLLKWSG